MRCLSPYSNFLLNVIAPRTVLVTDERGRSREVYEGVEVIAQFERRGLLEHEIGVALETFNFGGLPDGVNPLTRISVFDSEAYCEAMWEDDPEVRESMQKRIDAALLKHAEKLGPSMFIIVEHPHAPRPWPSYDEATSEEVIDWRNKLGIEPSIVRLYELENQERPEIIEAMLVLEGDEQALGRANAEGETSEEVKEGATITA